VVVVLADHVKISKYYDKLQNDYFYSYINYTEMYPHDGTGTSVCNLRGCARCLVCLQVKNVKDETGYVPSNYVKKLKPSILVSLKNIGKGTLGRKRSTDRIQVSHCICIVTP